MRWLLSLAVGLALSGCLGSPAAGPDDGPSPDDGTPSIRALDWGREDAAGGPTPRKLQAVHLEAAVLQAGVADVTARFWSQAAPEVIDGGIRLTAGASVVGGSIPVPLPWVLNANGTWGADIAFQAVGAGTAAFEVRAWAVAGPAQGASRALRVGPDPAGDWRVEPVEGYGRVRIEVTPAADPTSFEVQVHALELAHGTLRLQPVGNAVGGASGDPELSIPAAYALELDAGETARLAGQLTFPSAGWYTLHAVFEGHPAVSDWHAQAGLLWEVEDDGSARATDTFEPDWPDDGRGPAPCPGNSCG